MEVGERVNVNGVGGMTPSLYLLGDLLGVGWGEYPNDPGVFEEVREIIQKIGDSIGQTDRGEDTGAEEGVATEGVEKRVFGAGKVRMDPRQVEQLLDSKFTNWSFLTFPDPFQG